MESDQPMPNTSACPPKAGAINQRARVGRGDGKESPKATTILIQSGLAVVVATLCLAVGWPIFGLTFAILAFGMATVWVRTVYERSLHSGVAPPRWLAKLERLRQYLANEDDEPHDGGTSGFSPQTTIPAQQ
jgi:fatty acid desaturase